MLSSKQFFAGPQQGFNPGVPLIDELTPHSVLPPLREFFLNMASRPGDRSEYNVLSREQLFTALGVTGRKRDIPEKFSLLALEYPFYNKTTDGGWIVTFSFGLPMTDKDPKSGVVNGFWNVPSGPETFNPSSDDSRALENLLSLHQYTRAMTSRLMLEATYYSLKKGSLTCC